MVYIDKDDLLVIIGQNIKFERIKHGISIEEFSDYLNISSQMVSNMERGLRGTTIDTLIKIADIFNVTLDYLMGFDDSTLNFHSPKYENDKFAELMLLCSTLSDEEKDNVIKYIKDLIEDSDRIIFPDEENTKSNQNDPDN